ncbi:MAG: porin, partial [Gammaproteobacteria bacterium]|nr:porin [Gammaproteobacteria bacterium]
MKALTKKATTVAILAAMAAPGLTMADVTVYGKAHLAINSNSGVDSSEDVTVSSQNSRFGVKGSQELSEGLKAIYKMEWAVDMTDNNGKVSLDDADADGQVDID